jgi:hypothetical protein
MDRNREWEERFGAAGGTADGVPADAVAAGGTIGGGSDAPASVGEPAAGTGAAEAEPAEAQPAAGAASAGEEAVLELEWAIIIQRWERLTREDLLEAAGGRGALARVVARRYGISIREAKRQVRDMGRVVRSVEGGPGSRGKRMRRTFERTGRDIGEAMAQGVEGVRDLISVLSAGRLGGGSTTRLPRPRPETPPPGQPAGITAAPQPEPPTREHAGES